MMVSTAGKISNVTYLQNCFFALLFVSIVTFIYYKEPVALSDNEFLSPFYFTGTKSNGFEGFKSCLNSNWSRKMKRSFSRKEAIDFLPPPNRELFQIT